MNSIKEPSIREVCGTSAGYQQHRYYKESQCDPCRIAMNAQNQRLKKKARVSPRYRRNEKVKAHGLTLEKYANMLNEQNNVCAICKKPEIAKNRYTGEPRNMAIDHDHACCPGAHSCGKCVRGLLCHKCNSALGVIESVGSIDAFKAYLDANKVV